MCNIMDQKEEEQLLKWYEELKAEDLQIADNSDHDEQIEMEGDTQNETVEIPQSSISTNLIDEEDAATTDSDYTPSESSTSSDSNSEFLSEDESTPRRNQQQIQIQQQQQQQQQGWKPVTGSSLKSFPFSGMGVTNVAPGITPIIESYKLIVTNDILHLIVQETNKNAKRSKPTWKDIDVNEIENFFAIIMYMGLVRYPKISDYWSTKFLYRHSFVSFVMPRNRFQDILRFLHFSDNLTSDKNDRLYKVRPLQEALTAQFKKLRTPSEVVSIDESMVPFRDRLLIRQYIPGKTSKYGIKIFKLCDETGYTYQTEIYKGKSDVTVGRMSNVVVMNLMQDYLNEGRTLVADNYYNNIELTRTLLNRKTHVVGTMRKFVKNVPKAVMNEKGMKKGDIKGKECDGIVVANWKDKRNVRFITTRHTLSIKDMNKKNRKGEKVIKPEAIAFYNNYKAGIDLSDQMSSYFSVLRRTIRWYHKVALEYLFCTFVINALIIYQYSNSNKIQISEFREKLVAGLLGNVVNKLNKPESRKQKHTLLETTEKTKDNRKKRRRCIGCYEEIMAKERNSKVAAKKSKLVTTYCNDCSTKPAMCLGCFQSKH